MEHKRSELLKAAKLCMLQLGLPYGKALEVVRADLSVLDNKFVKRDSMKKFILELRRRLRLADLAIEQAWVRRPSRRLKAVLVSSTR